MAALARSLRSPRVLIALVMILCILCCAIFAGLIAPNDPGDQNSAFDPRPTDLVSRRRPGFSARD